jgi:hypothetical protein
MQKIDFLFKKFSIKGKLNLIIIAFIQRPNGGRKMRVEIFLSITFKNCEKNLIIILKDFKIKMGKNIDFDNKK